MFEIPKHQAKRQNDKGGDLAFVHHIEVVSSVSGWRPTSRCTTASLMIGSDFFILPESFQVRRPGKLTAET